MWCVADSGRYPSIFDSRIGEKRDLTPPSRDDAVNPGDLVVEEVCNPSLIAVRRSQDAKAADELVGDTLQSRDAFKG
jgi:hypothetical protein